MSRVKQASKRKSVARAAVPALGAAGLTFSLAGSAAASAVPAVDTPQKLNFSPSQAVTLGEEEIADVSLATFHLSTKKMLAIRASGARLRRLPRLSRLRWLPGLQGLPRLRLWRLRWRILLCVLGYLPLLLKPERTQTILKNETSWPVRPSRPGQVVSAKSYQPSPVSQVVSSLWHRHCVYPVRILTTA